MFLLSLLRISVPVLATVPSPLPTTLCLHKFVSVKGLEQYLVQGVILQKVRPGIITGIPVH
jgi:hypothetical protein